MQKIKSYFDKQTIKAYLGIIVYIICFELISLVAAKIFVATMSEQYIKDHVNQLNLALQFIVYVPLVVILFIMFRHDLKQDFDLYLEKPYEKAPRILWGLVAIYIANLAANLIATIADTSQAQNQTAIEEIVNFSWYSYPLMAILTVTIAPVCEELIFRKSFRNIIKNDYVFIVISSIFFAAMHMLSSDGKLYEIIIQSIPYFASGVVFGALYIKNDRNIMIPIICHMINNGISMAVISLL